MAESDVFAVLRQWKEANRGGKATDANERWTIDDRKPCAGWGSGGPRAPSLHYTLPRKHRPLDIYGHSRVIARVNCSDRRPLMADGRSAHRVGCWWRQWLLHLVMIDIAIIFAIWQTVSENMVTETEVCQLQYERYGINWPSICARTLFIRMHGLLNSSRNINFIFIW